MTSHEAPNSRDHVSASCLGGRISFRSRNAGHEALWRCGGTKGWEEGAGEKPRQCWAWLPVSVSYGLFPSSLEGHWLKDTSCWPVDEMKAPRPF